ncbi:hypothetical protein [Streptomyces lavendofoliae]|uniref:Uncharacterized protein n=1 Tax=Streptomyces lavendofoliae TaxID=67314 RepID=A0A918I1G0_9ACTN|nr:hypothetical protein [Streptomyces lavendofoliae]GGU54391.1 hypothetical protein GCM10010274_49370 [Streptomyces lavendofoliae]
MYRHVLPGPKRIANEQLDGEIEAWAVSSGSSRRADEDGGDVEFGQVDSGRLVVASGQATPLLQLVHAPLIMPFEAVCAGSNPAGGIPHEVPEDPRHRRKR